MNALSYTTKISFFNRAFHPHTLKNDYVFTKKLRQKSKIYDRKNDFLNFENMFLEHFCKAFNLQQTFSWYLTVFQKP